MCEVQRASKTLRKLPPAVGGFSTKRHFSQVFTFFQSIYFFLPSVFLLFDLCYKGFCWYLCYKGFCWYLCYKGFCWHLCYKGFCWYLCSKGFCLCWYLCLPPSTTLAEPHFFNGSVNCCLSYKGPISSWLQGVGYLSTKTALKSMASALVSISVSNLFRMMPMTFLYWVVHFLGTSTISFNCEDPSWHPVM